MNDLLGFRLTDWKVMPLKIGSAQDLPDKRDFARLAGAGNDDYSFADALSSA